LIDYIFRPNQPNIEIFPVIFPVSRELSVRFRPEDHQLIRPVVIVRGKAPKDMTNSEDYWEVLEVVPGEPLMQKPDAFGCSLGSYT
jgi:hypothetical protein